MGTNSVCKVNRSKRAFIQSWSSGRPWIHVIRSKQHYGN